MQVFYAPDISGLHYVLDENESKHIVRVLRMGKGTAVRLIDGKGNLFEGIIEEPDHKHCKISITGVQENFERRNYRLHMAISPIKNNDRFEWFIEKSVEIGVDEITPLICRNTEKTSIKAERINNIIISAMKQSLKSTLTKLNEPRSFDEFTSRKTDDVRMIAHCNNDYSRNKISEILKPQQDAIILIGPEGDFSKDEISMAIGHGFTGIHLGSSRLRTETAGVAACHSVYFINQE